MFFIDGMGWTDSDPYGSEFYEIPNIPKLADQGMRFTDAYVAPLCSPSRASSLTGKYPGRLRITKAITSREEVANPVVPKTASSDQKVVEPQNKTFLPLEEYTIAEALKDADYNTYHIGKWHLGSSEKILSPSPGV